MNSNNTAEGVYCYSVIPECEPQLMNCPRTGLLGRMVCKVKIGRSEDVVKRCEKEFSETLSQHRPDYDQVIVVETRNNVESENYLKKQIDNIAKKLGTSTLSVSDKNDKEIYYLTPDEILYLFKNIPNAIPNANGTFTELKKISKPDVIDKVEMNRENWSSLKFTRGKKFCNSHRNVQDRIDNIINSGLNLEQLLTITQNKKIKWTNPELGIHTFNTKNKNNTRNYSMVHLRYDLSNDFITMSD
tara:strand:- start:850 stop:1581 length:732 start_codon:yes stop_codon:yes gene_type:complete